MSIKCLLLLLFISACQSANDRPTITSPAGKIRGYHKNSAKGKPFSAFEGIPYAQPPIGAKRFEESEPVEPWKGTWDAIFVTECVQTDMMHARVVHGEEDCLYLNVYVPREKPDPAEKLDVIVHIHGGVFMYGSGHAYSHPEFFMDRDVIFVTFNYRLGIFGFLSTEDDVVPGNNGLKDQVLALKWVQTNIGSFGGNPNSVTLTGMSAGASSVHFHYLSHMSKGLFHRGFSQSGVALNSIAIQEEPLKKAKLLGEAVGCPIATTHALVKCLKQRPHRHILTKLSLFHGYLFTPIAPFAPVIEKGSKPFINKNPYYLLAKGQVQDLPWMASNVAHEGLFPGAFVRNDLPNVNENWTDIAPFLLDYNYTLATPLWQPTADKLKEFYLGKNEDINDDNFLKLVQMLSDRLLFDVESAVKLQSKATKSPIYYYHFAYPGNHSINNTVAHGEDGQYFFYQMFKREGSPEELKMKEVLLDMLLSFAKTGKPKIDGVLWEPTKFNELTYLNISSFEPEGIKLQRIKELTPRDFWKSLGLLENQNLILIKDEL